MFTLHLEANTFKELLQKVDEAYDSMLGEDNNIDEELEEFVPPMVEVFKPVGYSPVIPQVEVDSKGVLWDKLLHSANKFKNKDGTWRRRKGLEKKIEVGQPVVYTPPTEEVIKVASPLLVPIPPAAVPMVEPVIVNVPTAASGHTLETFKSNLISIISDLLSTGKITKEYVTALNTHFGVDQMWDIIADDAKVEQLFNHFVAEGYVEKAT